MNPITVVRTGKRGRPRKNIDRAFLENMFSGNRGLTMKEVSEAINIHPKTLKNYLKFYGLKKKFSNKTDVEIDNHLRLYRQHHPQAGLRYVTGYFRSLGHRFKRQRILEALHRTDGVGLRLRYRKQVSRPDYHSKRPNSLWSVDGHHKLILWGIIIAGIVDTYCRTVS